MTTITNKAAATTVNDFGVNNFGPAHRGLPRGATDDRLGAVAMPEHAP